MSDDLIERSEQIRFDVEYRKSDCEGKHWVKVNEFWYDEMVDCIPKLVAEIKRLREQVANQYESIETLCRDLDPQLVRLMKEKQELRKQLAAKDTELARWQEIAIEERAKSIWKENRDQSQEYGGHFWLMEWDRNPLSTSSIISEHDKSEYRKQASKELSIQIDQDDSDNLTIAYMLGSHDANKRLKVLQEYIKRLEEAWIVADGNILSLHRDRLSLDHVSEEKRMQYRVEAQTALEKIRHEM